MKNNIIPFRELSWLKAVDASDSKCEKILKAYFRKNKKILVVGSVGSGKNTIANALVTYMHELKWKLPAPSVGFV